MRLTGDKQEILEVCFKAAVRRWTDSLGENPQDGAIDLLVVRPFQPQSAALPWVLLSLLKDFFFCSFIGLAPVEHRFSV